jgi:hypothetical protein
MAVVLKTTEPVRVPGVRIPLPPPDRALSIGGIKAHAIRRFPTQGRLTRAAASHHAKRVMAVGHRLSAAIVTLALATGQVGVCAGWLPTPEARMACCSDESCPMHKSDESGSTRVLTQADADRCCAASEQDDATPSPSNLLNLITLGFVLNSAPAGLSVPEHHHAEIWRASVPIPIPHVSKHLLLSVFLV